MKTEKECEELRNEGAIVDRLLVSSRCRFGRGFDIKLQAPAQGMVVITDSSEIGLSEVQQLVGRTNRIRGIAHG